MQSRLFTLIIICQSLCQPTRAVSTSLSPIGQRSPVFGLESRAERAPTCGRMNGLTMGAMTCSVQHNYTCMHKHAADPHGALSHRSTTQTQVHPIPKNCSLHH